MMIAEGVAVLIWSRCWIHHVAAQLAKQQQQRRRRVGERLSHPLSWGRQRSPPGDLMDESSGVVATFPLMCW